MSTVKRIDVNSRVVEFIEMMPTAAFKEAFQAGKVYGVDHDTNLDKLIEDNSVGVQMKFGPGELNKPTTMYAADFFVDVGYHASAVLETNDKIISAGVQVSTRVFYKDAAASRRTIIEMINSDSGGEISQSIFYRPALAYLSLVLSNISASFSPEPLLLDLTQINGTAIIEKEDSANNQ